ncbi:hypothetical protein THAOC_01313, partial [Thalassiosira oceanica]
MHHARRKILDDEDGVASRPKIGQQRSRSGRSRQATWAEAEAAQFLPCGAVTLAGRAVVLRAWGCRLCGVLEIDDGGKALAAGDGRANDCMGASTKR